MFPDGAVFVSLEGNPSPGRAIVQVGEALEGVDFHKRDDADRRRWLAEELGHRSLRWRGLKIISATMGLVPVEC